MSAVPARVASVPLLVRVACGAAAGAGIVVLLLPVVALASAGGNVPSDMESFLTFALFLAFFSGGVSWLGLGAALLWLARAWWRGSAAAWAGARVVAWVVAAHGALAGLAGNGWGVVAAIVSVAFAWSAGRASVLRHFADAPPRARSESRAATLYALAVCAFVLAGVAWLDAFVVPDAAPEPGAPRPEGDIGPLLVILWWPAAVALGTRAWIGATRARRGSLA